MNNKADFTIGKIMAIIIGVIILILVITWFGKFELARTAERGVDFLRDFLGFSDDDNNIGPIEDYSFDCPYKVAEVKKGTGGKDFIYFCKDFKAECQKEESSYIQIEGDTIKLYGYNAIGDIDQDTFIYIRKYVRERRGDERDPFTFNYLDKEDLYPYEKILALHNAYFLSSAKREICNKEILTEEQARKNLLESDNSLGTVREIVVDGKTFYFDIDELINQKSNGLETPIYLDRKKTQPANSFINEEANSVYRLPEEGEDQFAQVRIPKEIIEKSRQNIDYYKDIENVYDGKYLEMHESLENPSNELGFFTDGDGFDYISFKRPTPFKTYVRFKDDDTFEIDGHETPWIQMDYWDVYRTFALAPSWALLEN